MKSCNIDHSNEEVLQKLQSQRAYLPPSLYESALAYLQKIHPQEKLNDLFHNLKKYDLATQAEQEERNRGITKLISIDAE